MEQDPNHMTVSINKLFHMKLLEFCVEKKVEQFIHLKYGLIIMELNF
jgi:hypothetical protein